MPLASSGDLPYPEIEPISPALAGGFFTVWNLPAMQETGVQSLGWEDPLDKGMATHSSILTWEIPGTEESGGLQSIGSQSVRYN